MDSNRYHSGYKTAFRGKEDRSISAAVSDKPRNPRCLGIEAPNHRIGSRCAGVSTVHSVGLIGRSLWMLGMKGMDLLFLQFLLFGAIRPIRMRSVLISDRFWISTLSARCWVSGVRRCWGRIENVVSPLITRNAADIEPFGIKIESPYSQQHAIYQSMICDGGQCQIETMCDGDRWGIGTAE